MKGQSEVSAGVDGQLPGQWMDRMRGWMDGWMDRLTDGRGVGTGKTEEDGWLVGSKSGLEGGFIEVGWGPSKGLYTLMLQCDPWVNAFLCRSCPHGKRHRQEALHFHPVWQWAWLQGGGR